MQLRCASLKAADSILNKKITEAGTPTWHFNYTNAEDDPYPDVLVLGDHINPETGNKLVGGINLHYLTPAQLDQLQQMLPSIMQGGNLKDRYHRGKEILPEVFDDCYRTYDTKYIRSISPDELQTWRPEPMPMPRKPLQRPSPQPRTLQPPPIAPGPQASPTTFQTPPARSMRRPSTPMPEPMPSVGATSVDQADLATLANAYKERMAAMSAAQQQQAEQEAEIMAQQKLEKERAANLSDLTRPKDGKDPLAIQPTGRMESITYYSPVKGRYVTESIRL